VKKDTQNGINAIQSMNTSQRVGKEKKKRKEGKENTV
jgi:hypothetical protein